MSAGNDDPPAGVSGQAWTRIQHQIEAKRHRVAESDRPGSLWRADSPSQSFVAHFGSEDIALVPLGRGEDFWKLGLRLTAWGAAHDLRPVDPASAIAEDNRVEYRRGPLTEWYLNTTMGLEQGFTIEVPPGDDIKELVLEMTLNGDLTPVLSENGQAVSFLNETTNTTLTYSGLAAWDSVGDALDARIELGPGEVTLRLKILVGGAAWPVTVDPIFTQVAKLLSTQEPVFENSWFGHSIAMDGDFMVAGMFDDENGWNSGSAYIFQRDQGGTNSWGEVAKITAFDGAADDHFADSVAISGDTIIVGARGDDDNGSWSGSAYVFERHQGGPDAWGQVAKITPPDGDEEDFFGKSVSIGGDSVIIGSNGKADDGLVSGCAYIFQRDLGGPNGWGQVAKITPADGTIERGFGASVFVNGDTAVVGAPWDNANGYNSGSAYVFRRDHGGPDAWGQVAKILATDGAEGDHFGSVSISGDIALVGAYRDDDNGHDSGSAYIFRRDHGGIGAWGQVAKLSAADGTGSDYFGGSVAISGDIAFVGASRDDSSTGSAYLFHRNQGGADAWGQVTKITAADGAEVDYFGGSVAISGDTIAVGAPTDDDNGTNSGSTYIFQRDQGGINSWGQVTKQSCPGGLTAKDEYFGTSVSISGDTAVVGAWGDDDNGEHSGAAHIFRRDESGPGAWGQVAKITAADGDEGDVFGVPVTISGDTAVVGAWGDDDNGVDSGSAYIFRRDLGGPDSWGQVAKITPADGAGEDFFGNSVSMSGDCLIVGAPGDDDYGSRSGSAYVFQRDQGGLDGWGQVAKITPADGAKGDFFGDSVSMSGDWLIVGAPEDDDYGSRSGSAYVFQRDQGGLDGWGQVVKISPPDGAADDAFGVSVVLGGDTAVVGAIGDDDNGSFSGSAYVFQRNHGGTDVWGQIAKITPADGAEVDLFGSSVTISGNTIVVSARKDDDNGSDSGSIYVFRRDRGGPDAWGQIAKITPADGEIRDQFGWSVSVSAGTVIAGAPYDDDGGYNSGSAHLFSISDWFFADGFEMGNTSGWSVTVQ